MGKKLLFLVFILIAHLLPNIGWSQSCTDPAPTVSINYSGASSVCDIDTISINSTIPTTSPAPTEGYTYQWQSSRNSGSWNNISGAISPDLDYIPSNFSPSSGNFRFRLIVTYCAGTVPSAPSSNITVNTLRIPSVSISTSTQTICAGQHLTFNATPTNGGNNPSYQWQINGSNVGTNSPTFSTSAQGINLQNNDKVTVILTSNVTCPDPANNPKTSNELTITVNPILTPSVSITQSDNNICPGDNITFTASPANGGNPSYQWKVDGTNVGTNSNTFSTNSLTDQQVVTVEMTSTATCASPTSTTSNSLTVDVKPDVPATPSAITGDTNVCPASPNVIYTVTNVSGVKYNWSLPTGWIGTSTTNSITATPGNYGDDGNISVTAEDSQDGSCGASAPSTLAVTIKPGKPDKPILQSGEAEVCPGSSQSYIVNMVPTATSYVWTLPDGWSGSSSTNSINVTTSTLGGDIKVTAINDCESSEELVLPVIIKDGIPVTPSVITRSNSTEPICSGDSEIFSVEDDPTADSYNWSVPPGWTITSGNNSNSVTVTAGNFGQNGTVTVSATNTCGTSNNSSLDVTIDPPAPTSVGPVSGPSLVCSTATGLNYSVPVSTNATDYTWTLPTGWTITGGNNSNSITVNASGTAGNITVTANNSCGNSSPASFAVGVTNSSPAQPQPITSSLDGNKNICPPATNITFSVPAAAGATSYAWTLPSAGWEITAGAGTNNITVRVTSAAAVGTQQVSVQAVNICGNSPATVYSGIEVANHIVTNAGADMTVCRTSNYSPITINASVVFGNSKFDPTFQTSGTGTFPGPIPKNESGNFTYQYKPSAADYAAGQVTLTMTVPRPNGNNGNCGTGGGNNGVDDMVLTFKPDPTASINGTTTICNGNSTDITFTATPNSIVTYNINGGTNRTISIGASGSAIMASGNLTTNTNYNLISIAYTGALACPKTISGSATITVTNPPNATISYSQPFCSSNNTSQLVTTTGTGTGTYSGTNGLSIDPSTGAILPSASDVGIHAVTLTIPASGGCPEYTTTTNVQIIEEVQITIPPLDLQVCEGESAQFNLTATGENLSYQWYKGSIGSGTPISGATTSSLNIDTITLADNGDYYVTVNGSSPCGAEDSAFNLTVDEKINISTQPVPQEVCENGTATFNVTASAGDNPLTYQWFKGTPGSGTLLTGETNDVLEIVAISPIDSGSYYVEIDASGTYNCSLVISEVATLTVKENLSIDINSDVTQLCEGGSTQLNFINGTPNSVVTYSKDGVTQPSITINASGQATVSTGALSSSGTTPRDYIYQLVQVEYLNPPPCPIDLSTIPPVTITVNATPSVDIGYASTEFCNSDDSIYTIVTNNESGDWQGGTFSSSPSLTIDTNTGSFNPKDATAGIYTITYTTPENGGCSATTSSIDVTIHNQVVIANQPSNLGICSSKQASFEVIATGSNLTYQWFKDGAAIAGATSAELAYNNATLNDAGTYYVEVSGSSPCSSAISDSVSLNVDEDINIIEPAEDVEICANSLDPVVFKFIAYAGGEPLNFEWYKEASPNDILQENTANINIITYDPGEDPDDNTSPNYSGTLTISGIDMTNKDQFEGVYYVKITSHPDSNFNCPNAVSKTFSLSILEVPALPTTEDFAVCTDSTPPLITDYVTGNELLWYSSETSDDGSSIAPIIDTSVASDITYWVSQTPVFCESERAPIRVVVNQKPLPPTGTAELHYCEGDTAAPWDIAGSNLTWYSDAALTSVISEPIIETGTAQATSYWVTQRMNYDSPEQSTCESESLKVDVTIHALPVITVTSEFERVCAGSPTQLYASGAFTYEWFDEANNSLGTGDNKSVNPTTTTTYKVVGVDANNRCSSEANITINVDPLPVGGMLTGPLAVCAGSNSGNLTLTGHSGTIQRWESSIDGGITWLPIGNTSTIEDFTNLTQDISYRVVLGSENGVCQEVYSNVQNIQVDPTPVGGELLFADNNDRLYSTCENPTNSSLSDLRITGYSGDIISWKYRTTSATSWTNLAHTGATLSASTIAGLSNNQTLIFQVEIGSGVCTPNALSQTAILSVIPSDIEPAPVTIDPDVLCYGDPVTLSSSTGYGNSFGKFEGGAFDNAGLVSKGWRFRRENSSTDLIFETDANNRRPDRWERATRHQFTTRDINSPYNINENLYISSGGPKYAGNKGFAIVSSGYDATMETPVFALGSMDQAILTWDQMYNLTPGASIHVEISTDGGVSYNTVLYSVSTPPEPTNTTGVSSENYDGFSIGTIASHPKNKIQVDLGNYMGQPNLRVRFNYNGIRIGDVWAVDNITIPDGPRGVELLWYDYTDENNPVYIGNSETEIWHPTKIGYNEFEVRTKLLLDSSGNTCQSIENFERVIAFAFDQYNSTTTIVTGSCGNTQAQLSGIVEGVGTVNGGPPQGFITSFPTLDGYVASWEAIDTNGTILPDTVFYNEDGTSDNAINNPNAIFNPEASGTFTLTWKLTQTEFVLDNQGNNFPVPINDGCPPIYVPADMSSLDCTTLDFDGVNDYVDLGTSYNAAYSLEAWVRPEAPDGTIISKKDSHTSGAGYELYLNNSRPVFRWDGGVLTASDDLDINNRWYHLAVSFDGSSATLYIDGIEMVSHTTGSSLTNSDAPLLIGASYDILNSTTTNHFSGWIEEVRLWNTKITENQIRFLMNQHLVNNGAQMGEQIPMDVPDGLTYANLAGYYRLIAQINAENPDPAFQIVNGFTPDMALNSIPGRLNNMETYQENTAPLPYTSRVDGQTWGTDNTWTHWPVWDVPNSNGVNGDPIDWNIAVTNHNIDSGNKEITVLGLKSLTPDKLLKIADPSSAQNETNLGEMLRVTHYLRLDGNIDLVGESQLLQDQGSILEEASQGWLERDQQGKKMSFNYNYWSSPVSAQGIANNSPYLPGDVMSYDVGGGSITKLQFTADGNPYGADNTSINTCPYWLWKFHGLADDYDSWEFIGSTGTLKTGEGHTMKGTYFNGTADYSNSQNYIYKGKPHNGDFTLNISTEQNYLIGNPYPSSMDAHEFILDNLDGNQVTGARNNKNVFNGALYFWDHFSGATHILREYIGGYGVYNLIGGVRAYSTDERINNSDPSAAGGQPKDFIPVGQGFFVSTVVGPFSSQLGGTIQGDIVFKNSQRVYFRENTPDSLSIFLKPEYIEKESIKQSIAIEKIRLGFKSPVGYHRQLLVGAHPATTDGFDIGYDAPLIEYNVEDMYWIIGNSQYVIQGVPDFNENRRIAVGINLKEGGEFKFELDKVENMSSDKNIYIYDKVYDITHDIRKGPYITTSNVGGYIDDRFELVFKKQADMPINDGEPISEDGPEIIEDPEILPGGFDFSVRHSYTYKEIQILNPEMHNISNVYLFDMNGNLIEEYQQIPRKDEILLRVRNYSTGVYILKVYTDNMIINKKIIIKD